MSAVFSALLAIGGVASAAKVPFSFAPAVAQNPTRTQQKLTALEAKLPASFALPSQFVSLTSSAPAGGIQVAFAPEVQQLLDRARTSGPGLATWPGGTPALCTKHAAFTPPVAILVQPPSPACSAADQKIRQKLAAITMCRDVEQPERYVLGAPRGVVNDATTQVAPRGSHPRGEVQPPPPPVVK